MTHPDMNQWDHPAQPEEGDESCEVCGRVRSIGEPGWRECDGVWCCPEHATCIECDADDCPERVG